MQRALSWGLPMERDLAGVMVLLSVLMMVKVLDSCWVHHWERKMAYWWDAWLGFSMVLLWASMSDKKMDMTLELWLDFLMVPQKNIIFSRFRKSTVMNTFVALERFKDDFKTRNVQN